MEGLRSGAGVGDEGGELAELRVIRELGGDDGAEDEAAILGEDASGCSCVFGNPCAAPHCCKDWRHRFEVARKHGWKGF